MGWSREKVRSISDIPCGYYLNRGYSKKILDKYDVGFNSQSNRVIVPIYNKDYSKVMGLTCRSIFEECSKCEMFHKSSDKCPHKSEFLQHCKWRNTKNFHSSNYLYNFWFAKEYIISSRVAILVEGPGDVWKLEESGIHNSLALFGCDMTDEQNILLDRSGALSLIVMLDPDKAGSEGMREIKERLSRTYRLYFPKIGDGSKDIGDLNTDKITSDIVPMINKVIKCEL